MDCLCICGFDKYWRKVHSGFEKGNELAVAYRVTATEQDLSVLTDGDRQYMAKWEV